MSSNPRLDKRREILRQKAMAAGYDNWSDFESAVRWGAVELPRKAGQTVLKSRKKGSAHAKQKTIE
jgi:hypothetical protein